MRTGIGLIWQAAGLFLTEICGRYGPWVARGARLMNALAPEVEVAVVAVEQDVTSWQWCCIALRQ